MSDNIKHECGIALIRLRKPLQYYIDKYGTPLYGINKLYLLMEKQRNRGQDGAGIVTIKLNVEPGIMYISRKRSAADDPVTDIFSQINKRFKTGIENDDRRFFDAEWLKETLPYTGELLMGHLRYGTHGKNGIAYCHPMLRRSNWRSKSLVLAGNFNMTNTEELFQNLIELGQHPKEKIDTVTVIEKIGHFLDEENERLYEKYKTTCSKKEITDRIESELDINNVLEKSCKDFDGGYAMGGLTGYGTAFAARDPAGIRPLYYYADDEVIVAASEKPAIKTAFDIQYNEIREVEPGQALIVEKDGSFALKSFIKPTERKACSFERIYFSRGSDPDIYNERKKLGELVCPQVLEAVDYDFKNTVFSYIPNTAETAFLGLLSSLENYLIDYRKKIIAEGKIKEVELDHILALRPRVEKLAIKDAKLRTFITGDEQRNELVAHVYDTTYEVINKNTDTVVLLDDSIVRGTTLERSILRMLDRLGPKKIIIVSSAPQIRYPDCYGIDMSRMNDFVAFRAVIRLLREQDKASLIEEVYNKCKQSFENGNAAQENFVKRLYDEFTDDEITEKIAQTVRPDSLKAELTIIYQSVKNLNKACPNHLGDWYFTGNYPTPGGNKVVNRAFMNYIEGKTGRGY